MNLEEKKLFIETRLNQKISHIKLKASGMCNDVFSVKTQDGTSFLIKEERSDKETTEQNSLSVESRLLQRLNILDPLLPIPRVVFSSEDPVMFGYEHIDGEMLCDARDELTKSQLTVLFDALGNFQGRLGQLIDREAARGIGIRINDEKNIDAADLRYFTEFLRDASIPEDWKTLAKTAKAILEETKESGIARCIHNDLHDKNIIVDHGQLVGVVDFGDAEYSDAHKDFCYHVRQYPEYLSEVTKSFQRVTGQTISIRRAVAYAAYSDLRRLSRHLHDPDDEERFVKDGYGTTAAKRVENYQHLLSHQ